MRKNFIYVLIITIVFLLTSYTVYMGKTYYKTESNYNYVSLQKENDKKSADYSSLKKQLENTEDEIVSLQHENDKLKQEVLNNRIYNQDDIFEWMKTDKWTEVSISDESNHNIYKIKDPILLNMQVNFLGNIRSGYEPQAKTIRFIYSFKKGNETYILNVYKENIFEYNNEFYEGSGNLYSLADAFLPYEKEWLKPNNLFSIVYNSNVIVSNKTVTVPIVEGSVEKRFSLGISYYLSNLKELKKPLKKALGELFERVSLYNHGEIIQMYIYKDYLKLLYNGKEYWFQGNDNYSPNEILSVLSAG